MSQWEIIMNIFHYILMFYKLNSNWFIKEITVRLIDNKNNIKYWYTWHQTEVINRSLLRRTWLMITFTLASLLSVSLLVHGVRACCGSTAARFPERRAYSYIPLNDINGAASRAGGDAGKSGEGGFGLDESDSQDEIWSPSHSGRS